MNYLIMKLALIFLFLPTFLCIIAWVFRPNSKTHYQSISKAPLEDE